MTILYDLDVLIPAAGKGTRAGLDYPKTLYKIEGKEILLHILELVEDIDSKPTLIVSPDGKKDIENFLFTYNRNSHLVVQESPLGMGNAVLHFKESPVYKNASNTLLIWGDIPFIRKETITNLIKNHFNNNNDFTLITKEVNSAYTLVKRDQNKKIIQIIETREMGLDPQKGERDIGLFLFKKELVLNILEENHLDKFGNSTGEHGFLYIIKYLAKRGFKIQGLPVAKEKELKSLNSINDLI